MHRHGTATAATATAALATADADSSADRAAAAGGHTRRVGGGEQIPRRRDEPLRASTARSAAAHAGVGGAVRAAPCVLLPAPADDGEVREGEGRGDVAQPRVQLGEQQRVHAMQEPAHRERRRRVRHTSVQQAGACAPRCHARGRRRVRHKGQVGHHELPISISLPISLALVALRLRRVAVFGRRAALHPCRVVLRDRGDRIGPPVHVKLLPAHPAHHARDAGRVAVRALRRR